MMLDLNMEITMNFTVSTKANEKAQAKQTVVNIIFDDAEAERALAVSALIVKAQGKWRKGGIPATATLKISEFAPGVRHQAPVDVFEVAKGLTPDEKARLIAQLTE